MSEIGERRPVSIRRARIPDVARLAILRLRFRSEVGDAVESEAAFLERCAKWMEPRLGQQSQWRCWVAEVDGSILGQIWLQIIEKIPNPVRETEFHAYITNVYVEPAMRGRGYASEMLEAALEWSRGQQVHRVFLWATTKSRSLYERHGFRSKDDVMQLAMHE